MVNFIKKDNYTRDDLIACAKGELFGLGNPQLPMPPMLMIDRITTINDTGGASEKGEITAEFDISPDLWFFECHFIGDPVMPGCLTLDALWQLLGFYLGWAGGEGRGRALSVGEMKLTGQITPTAKMVTFKITLKRLIMRKITMGVADAVTLCDGEPVLEANDIRVGLFKDIA